MRVSVLVGVVASTLPVDIAKALAKKCNIGFVGQVGLVRREADGVYDMLFENPDAAKLFTGHLDGLSGVQYAVVSRPSQSQPANWLRVIQMPNGTSRVAWTGDTAVDTAISAALASAFTPTWGRTRR